MNGKVKWYNNQKGYGFITSENGEDVFVHYSSIDDDIKELYENEQVLFDTEINDRGLTQAIRLHRKRKDKNGMTEKDFHSCRLLDTIHNISVQKINGSWLWCFWDDKKGNTAHGIRNCPYCGKLLAVDTRTKAD